MKFCTCIKRHFISAIGCNVCRKPSKPINFDTVVPVEQVSSEEMDIQTCSDIVEDSRADYENSREDDVAIGTSYEYSFR